MKYEKKNCSNYRKTFKFTQKSTDVTFPSFEVTSEPDGIAGKLLTICDSFK